MNITVTNQKIVVTQEDYIVSGSVKIYDVEFTFDASWDGYIKTAVFSTMLVSKEVILLNDKCQIPWEVLSDGGNLKIGVYGTAGDKTKPTIYTQERLQINCGATQTDPTQEPTPSLYQQLLNKSVPTGGAAGQVLSKKSEADNDCEWVDQQSGGAAGKSPYIGENGNWFEWSGTGFVDTGTRAEGPQGERGLQGETGAQGKQGIQGIQGPKGDQGLQGVKGDAGQNGTDGATGITFTPSVSASGNISWTNDGGKTNPTAVNIKGPKGDTGNPGADGAKGNDGAAGADGTTFTPSVAANGDLSWSNDGGKPNPSTVNIKGPKGDTGAKGDQGAPGMNGTDGAKGDKGDPGVKGDAGADGAPGAKGDTGHVFTPSVSTAGVISWTNNGSLPNPSSVDLIAAVLSALPNGDGVSY